MCAEAGLEAVLPLWQEPRRGLLEELWAAGFKSVVVCTDDRYLGPEYCGREFDRDFVASLPESVDACGENGEFHTFVYDGPTFREPLTVAVVGSIPYTAPPEFGGASYHFAELR